MDTKNILDQFNVLETAALSIELINNSWSVTGTNEVAKKIIGSVKGNNYDTETILKKIGLDLNSIDNKQKIIWQVNINSTPYKALLKPISDNKSLIKLEDISIINDNLNQPSEISLFRTLLNYSPDLIYFKDKEARFIVNSKSHCEIFGVGQEDLIGKTDKDFFSDGEIKYKDDLGVINTGIPIINKEEPDNTPATKNKWVSSTKLPIKDDNDNIIGLFGISRDITEKRNAELKIKILNKNFEELIKTTLGFQQTTKIENIYSITANLLQNKYEGMQLVFLYKNPSNNKFDIFQQTDLPKNTKSSFRKIIEYIISNLPNNREDLEKDNFTINLDDFLKQKAIKAINEIEFRNASVHILKDKSKLLGYSILFKNIKFEDHDNLFMQLLTNQLTLTIARINLIEELNSSMLQAKESDKLKTAFLNNISHEIRTPLNSVIGYSQIIKVRLGNNNTKLKTFADNVVSNAKILLELFEDILEMSKIESGKISIIEHETNIDELIGSLNTYLKEQLLRHDKTQIKTACTVTNSTDKIIFHIDSVRVLQLLKAIISNAVKFTEEGKIEIGYLIDSKSEIKFFIEDTGIGIPDEISEIIFNLFRQGDDSATRKYGGIGVGLSIANALSNYLGGKITFKSAPNEGSTFTFTLPV